MVDSSSEALGGEAAAFRAESRSGNEPAQAAPAPVSAAFAGGADPAATSSAAAPPSGSERWGILWQEGLASRRVLASLREEAAPEPEPEPDPPPAASAEEEEIVPPRLVHRVTPPYPPRARRLGIEADVLLEVDIDETGVPRAVRILQSSGRLDMDAAAIEAAKAQRYLPATRSGQPIPYTIEQPVAFRLTD